MDMRLEIVVLAAGHGTRMRSKHPKVLHQIGGRSLLQRVLDSARALEPQQVHVIVDEGSSQVREAVVDEDINWVTQSNPSGTGHALQQALPHIEHESQVLVLYGDVPLITAETLTKTVQQSEKGLALLTAVVPKPQGYGRIIRDEFDEVERIVEDADLVTEQEGINEINSGIMCGSAQFFRQAVDAMDNNNAQHEYYLTDAVGIARDLGMAVHAVLAGELEIQGVNTRQQLAELERVYQRNRAEMLMDAGVTIMDPDRIDIRGNVSVDEDSIIDINVVLEGDIRIGKDVRIGPNCCLRDVQIGEGTVLHANTWIEGANLGKKCEVGPFARIRAGTELADDVKVGNFVELKKAHLGEGVKAGHFGYVGDAVIGTGTNVGAGAVTCNFDGERKNRTEIGDRVFIGTNSTLVAPLTIEADAFIAAGSTITKTVDSRDLAVGRSRQRNIKGWSRPK